MGSRVHGEERTGTRAWEDQVSIPPPATDTGHAGWSGTSHSAAAAPGICKIGLTIFISFVKCFQIRSCRRARRKAVQLTPGKKETNSQASEARARQAQGDTELQHQDCGRES